MNERSICIDPGWYFPDAGGAQQFTI